MVWSDERTGGNHLLRRSDTVSNSQPPKFIPCRSACRKEEPSRGHAHAGSLHLGIFIDRRAELLLYITDTVLFSLGERVRFPDEFEDGQNGQQCGVFCVVEVLAAKNWIAGATRERERVFT